MSVQQVFIGKKRCEVVTLHDSASVPTGAASPLRNLLHQTLQGRKAVATDRGTLIIVLENVDALQLLCDIAEPLDNDFIVHRADGGKVSFVVFGSALASNPLLGRLVAHACDLRLDDDHLLELIDWVFVRQVDLIEVAEEVAASDAGEVVEASFSHDPIRSGFDEPFYRASCSDAELAGLDPFEHYMTIGWKQGRDPSPGFSTSFYLDTNPDIAAAGVNPFEHWVLFGQAEMRRPVGFRQLANLRPAKPKVVAIVPNFNHAIYLEQRLNSILDQTYDNIEIVVLDDCSKDHSREVIERFVALYPGRIRAIFNETNSGGVFRQWRKGVEETDSDLIWICESDDFCEPDFVEKLVGYFNDGSVSIAFGRIQDTDENGVFRGTLDDYREGAEAGIWDRPLVRPAATWFANGFGVNNLIANVGGCLWRRSHIPETVWTEAQTFKVVGDWFLYIEIARGGQIAWEPGAVAYFRRHDDSTSFKSYVRPFFYEELERLMLVLRSKWDVPLATVQKFYGKVAELYEMFKLEEEFGPLEQYCDLGKLIAVERQRPHILVAFYGFIPGGGESFPINLANGLKQAGWLVSVLIFEGNDVNAAMRASLDPAIAVYESAWVDEYGADRFLRDAGIDLVHSHNITSEIAFFRTWKIAHKVAYLATLHGSYEAHGLDDGMLEALKTYVNHFVYTADKNLAPLAPLKLADSKTSKLANSMPIDPAPFEMTRAEMGIAEDAVVFTLVARGVLRKGWRASILAFLEVRRRNPGRPMHLLLCGTGEEPDRLKAIYGDDPDITFLGYQSRMHGLYRLTDVAVVPTRFAGESFPLCIIQALQVGAPVISSRMGEIPNMLTDAEQNVAGRLIDVVRDTDTFIGYLADAMNELLDSRKRAEAMSIALNLGKTYDMDKLVELYGDLYRHVILEQADQQ